MKVGRILVRKDKVVGLFVPFHGEEGMEPGIYEIQKVLDELVIVRIGDPAMDDVKLQSVSIEQLIREPDALMTAEEMSNIDEDKL